MAMAATKLDRESRASGGVRLAARPHGRTRMMRGRMISSAMFLVGAALSGCGSEERSLPLVSSGDGGADTAGDHDGNADSGSGSGGAQGSGGAGTGGTAAGSGGATAMTITTSPEDQSVGVDPRGVITATFSRDIAADTLNASTFLLSLDGTSVDGTVSYEATTRVATFQPKTGLVLLGAYRATVTTGVTDAAGTPLAFDRAWSFSVRDGQWGAAQLLDTADTAGGALSSQVVVDSAPPVTPSPSGNRPSAPPTPALNSTSGRSRFVEGDHALLVDALDRLARRLGLPHFAGCLPARSSMEWASFTSSAVMPPASWVARSTRTLFQTLNHSG